MGNLLNDDDKDMVDGLLKSKQEEVRREKRPTLAEQKAKVFAGLSGAEKKEVVKKPNVEIKMEEVGRREQEKERALLKTGKFRGIVQKDVMALNKDLWVTMSKEQRLDAIRTESDKRVRQTYPNAQYGKIKNRKGWYIKGDKDEWILVSPWNE